MPIQIGKFWLIVGICLATSASGNELRKLAPPNLSGDFVLEKSVGYRPMRQGSPAMHVEMTGRQVIAHNYGHGGSGWTLGPGAVDYVLSQLISQKDIDKNQPVAVVGAGVMGLLSAFKLTQMGFAAVTIYAESFDKTTSDVAGGLLAPVSMANDAESAQLIDKIGIDSHRFYHDIASGIHPTIPVGARFVPLYVLDREASGLSPYVDAGVMAAPKPVTIELASGTRRKMFAYDDNIFIDTVALMDWLHSYLEDHVQLVHGRVEKFCDLKENIVINCSGLGAKKLAGDSKLVPVQGHLILLKNQKPSDLQYLMMTYGNSGVTDSGFPIKRSFYIFPKQLLNASQDEFGVIGGTFIEGATEETPHDEEFSKLINQARIFFGLENSD